MLIEVDCYSLHTAVSCENILFLDTKIWLLPPFPPRLDGGLLTHADKKDTDSLCTGDPSASEKAQGEVSLLGTQLHDCHHADSKQLHTDRPMDAVLNLPSQLALKFVSEEEPLQQSWMYHL